MYLLRTGVGGGSMSRKHDGTSTIARDPCSCERRTSTKEHHDVSCMRHSSGQHHYPIFDVPLETSIFLNSRF